MTPILQLAMAATIFSLGATIVSAADNLPALADPTSEFSQRAATAGEIRCMPTDSLLLPVELSPGADLITTFDEASGRLHMRYRMAFNQLTEGWNWHPEAVANDDDYYRFKYLPIKSVLEERQGYRHEDKIGEPQHMRVQWRFDYFFAFDNLYDFYPRTTDDDAGFAAEAGATLGEANRLRNGDLRMALRGRLATICVSESTTFWKAIFSNPVDFTLKKRYLIGSLEEILFYDHTTRRILARVPKTQPKQPE